MAQIVPRLRADGGTSYQVKRCQDGCWQTENFASSGPKAAESFRLAVEAAGSRLAQRLNGAPRRRTAAV